AVDTTPENNGRAPPPPTSILKSGRKGEERREERGDRRREPPSADPTRSAVKSFRFADAAGGGDLEEHRSISPSEKVKARVFSAKIVRFPLFSLLQLFHRGYCS